MQINSSNNPLRFYEILERAAQCESSLSFILYVDDLNKKNKSHNKTMLNLMSLLGDSDYPIEVSNKNEKTVELTVMNDAVKYMYDQYLIISKEGNQAETDKR